MKCLFALSVIFTIVLFLTSVTALSIETKSTYQPGETLITQIKGVVLEPITKERIELLRKGYIQVPIEYDVKKIGPDYFLYALMPQNANNYTLVVHNVTTLVNGQVTSLDIRQNLSVSGPIVGYSIKPGFAILDSSTEFTLTLNEDQSRNIFVGEPVNQNYTLNPGENRIKIVNNFEAGLYQVSIGMYLVPINVLPRESTQRNTITFFPRRLEAVVLSGRDNVVPFRIINDFSEPVRDIVIIYNNSFFSISPNKISSLSVNQSADFNLTIKKNTRSFTDKITVKYGENSYELPVVISYTEDNNSVQVPYLQNYSQGGGKYCSELQGSFCATSYTCTGQTISARDGTCCIGTCTPPAKKSYTWIGYGIGLIILIVLIIIGGRYLKTRKQGTVAKLPLTR